MPSRTARAQAPSRRKYDAPIEERLADEARFFKSWLDNPALAGAVSPSGRFLARAMARYVDPQKRGPVIELGPGTGAITEALLERGIAPSRLFLIEFDPNFCKLLKRRFRGVQVIEGDAYRLADTLADRLRRKPSAIVSSLPLLLKPEAQRLELLAAAFDCLAKGGCFIQFTYGPVSPMPRDKISALSIQAEASQPVWLNLPPARVWVYRRAAEVQERPAPKRPNPAQEFFDRLKLGTEKIHLDLRRELAAAKERLLVDLRHGPPPRKGLSAFSRPGDKARAGDSRHPG